MFLGGYAMDPLSLINAVDEKLEKVRTRSLDLSFNELLDMFDNNELIINPDFQRLFRWSEGKQSRFIETLILEMPVPPIFVIEIDEGVYELIDGLQRISSYLHFRGHHPLKKNEDGTPKYLKLSECDIVTELNDFTYPDLPKTLEIKLKRNFIRVEVLRKESDKRLRYHMFKRLNTGGETLSDQEVRNATIRLLDDTINTFIIDLSNNPDFKQCITNVSDEKFDAKYDQELVLRFFAFKNYRKRYVHEVGDFMTEYMEQVAAGEVPFEYDQERAVFTKTFTMLSCTLGEHSFSGINPQGKPVSRFASYHYEAFTLGLQPYLDRLNPENREQMEALRDALLSIKADTDFKKITTGGGKNYANQLQERIGFVENWLGTVL
jgi:hypothetical protein